MWLFLHDVEIMRFCGYWWLLRWGHFNTICEEREDIKPIKIGSLYRLCPGVDWDYQSPVPRLFAYFSNTDYVRYGG
jgi:hypothetical protein